MSSPTRADCWDRLVEFADIESSMRTALVASGAKYDTALEALEGDRMIDHSTASLASLRLAGAQAVDPGRWRNAILPVLLDYAHAAGIPWSDVSGDKLSWLLEEVKADMAAQGTPLTIQTRDLVVGSQSPSATGGKGPILRLAVDRHGYPLDATHVETKTWQVLRDANMGAQQGREVWQMRGTNPERWPENHTGSGIATAIQTTSCLDFGALQNPSFDVTHGTTASATDKVSGWTITSNPTNLARQATYYKRAPGTSAANSASLEFTGAATIVQYLSERNGAAFNQFFPYQLVFAFKKTNSGATGTLTASLGSTTLAVTLGSYADTDWHFANLALDEDLYMANWNEASAEVGFALSGVSAGSLYVDDVVLAPMRLVDGHWWMAVGGSTPFLLGDAYTFATTYNSTEGKVAAMLWRAGLGSFPNDASPSIADPV